MSRAFLKNESADDPVVIPARAPLAPGTINYVTQRGLRLLTAELDDLERERTQLPVSELDETERTRQLALINGRMGALNQRIASAKVVESTEHSEDAQIRFGATVTLRNHLTMIKPAERQWTIVGVDEADATKGLIAFTAPIARQLVGKRMGDSITLQTPKGPNTLDIVAVTYEPHA